ncbi:MAG: hypothetical protein IJC36_04375 [Clostridia bacterium]|nr:hypothetical protein [Clostridia bacterium]
MKRVIALILVIVLCAGLCACGGSSNSESAKTPKEAVISAVRARVMVEVKLSYDITGVPTVTTYVNEIDETTYEVSGKVTVKDKYGDSYTGKYDAEVDYDPSTGGCNVDLDLGSLYKD